MLDWHFNGWAKYADWTSDDRVPAFVAEQLRLDRRQPTHRGRRVVLEGGSIDVNGRGLLLTTEECLLSTYRSATRGSDRADYEGVFAEYLGVRKVLWLNRGIAGDDTHGHVDDLARFVTGQRTVVAASRTTPPTRTTSRCRRTLPGSAAATDLDGRPLDGRAAADARPVVVRRHAAPGELRELLRRQRRGDRAHLQRPRRPRRRWRRSADLFPGREVVGIHCVDLVWGLGTLHCMTQQEPAGAALA